MRTLGQVTILFSVVILSACGNHVVRNLRGEGDSRGANGPSTDPVKQGDQVCVGDSCPKTNPPADTPDEPAPDYSGFEGGLRMLADDVEKKKPLPENAVISPEELAAAYFDPNKTSRCSVTTSDAYTALAKEVGGYFWGYGMTYYRNERLPYLYPTEPMGYPRGGEGWGGGVATNDMAKSAESAPSANQASTPAPTISRADLIGRNGNQVVFLSKRFGLFFVDVTGGTPKVSCTVQVPGQPVNFYLRGARLVLLTNPTGDGSTAAAIHYELGADSIRHLAHHKFPKQRIEDSRLFNDTVAVMGRFYEHVKIQPVPVLGDVATSSVAPGIGYSNPTEVTVLTALKIAGDNFEVKFEDSFADQNVYATGGNLSDSLIGKPYSRYAHFNNFLSASDRYLVMSRQVNEQVVTGFKVSRYSMNTCLKYNPNYKQVSNTYCHADWQAVANPKFDPTFTCTGNQATFDRCIADNKDKFVQTFWNYRGKVCNTHSYWLGRCEAYGVQVFEQRYPLIKHETSTELIIYRFEGDTFSRLDDPTGRSTIKLPGIVKEHKSLNFRDGYLYSVASTAGMWNGSQRAETVVASFRIEGNAFIPTGKVTNIGVGEQLRAVLFTAKMLYLVTFRQIDPLFAIDLSTPHAPKLMSELEVPGFSSQLIATGSQLIGIGQGSPVNDLRTSHAKVSLYDVSNPSAMRDLDTQFLGSTFGYTYTGVDNDDQLFHFRDNRLFLAYQASGEVKNDYDGFVCNARPYVQRNFLSVTKMTSTGVDLEGDLRMSQPILRSITITPDHAIAFADSAINEIKWNGASWENRSVRDAYLTEGLYTDRSLPNSWVVARQSRSDGSQLRDLRFVVGTKAQLAAGEFAHSVALPTHLLACLQTRPTVRFLDNNILAKFSQYTFKDGKSIVYNELRAWRITDKGIVELTESEAKELDKEQYNVCWFKVVPEKIKFKELVKGVTEVDLVCKPRPVRPWNPQIFCDVEFGGTPGHSYCAL